MRSRPGQALVEFALLLPALIAVMMAVVGSLALTVQVEQMHVVAIRELASGASSAYHVYGHPVRLRSAAVEQTIRPGQSLGLTWTRWLQSHSRAGGPMGGWACLEVSQGWLTYQTGPVYRSGVWCENAGR